MRTYEKLYINGEWIAPSGQATSEVINPATNAVTTRVPSGDESDVDRAVLAARAAFASWSQTTTALTPPGSVARGKQGPSS